MHTFHAWIELNESAQECDLGQLEDKVVELQALVAGSRWHDAVFEIQSLNGGHFSTATGLINRRRAEGERLDLFLDVITRRLPGSHGLIYERDDEMPGPYAYRVKVMARGQITEHPDPFLSPCNPVIEDYEDQL